MGCLNSVAVVDIRALFSNPDQTSASTGLAWLDLLFFSNYFLSSYLCFLNTIANWLFYFGNKIRFFWIIIRVFFELKTNEILKKNSQFLKKKILENLYFSNFFNKGVIWSFFVVEYHYLIFCKVSIWFDLFHMPPSFFHKFCLKKSSQASKLFRAVKTTIFLVLSSQGSNFFRLVKPSQRNFSRLPTSDPN